MISGVTLGSLWSSFWGREAPFLMLAGVRSRKRRARAGAPNQNRFFIDFGVCPKAFTPTPEATPPERHRPKPTKHVRSLWGNGGLLQGVTANLHNLIKNYCNGAVSQGSRPCRRPPHPGLRVEGCRSNLMVECSGLNNGFFVMFLLCFD